MRLIAQALILSSPLLLGLAPQGNPPGTWQPQPDPQSLLDNPGPNDDFFMQEISFTYVDRSGNPDPDIEQWFKHHYHPKFEGQFALGDLSGKDDGDTDIAIVMGGEAVLAARMSIDYPSKTGTLTPIFMYLTPEQASECVVEPSGKLVVPPNHVGKRGTNLLIWDFDGDGRNEVAVQLQESSGRYVAILQHDPDYPLPSTYGYEPPEPMVLAKSVAAPPTSSFHDRMGLIKVTNTPYAQHIIMNDHNSNDFGIWEVDPPNVFVKYEGNITHSGGPLIMGADSVKTHEYNYVDIDDDGLEEVMLNGVVDFVDADANGDPVPINGAYGKSLWVTGYPSFGAPGIQGHMDQMMAADWDPTRPGLEIVAVTEGVFTAPSFMGAPPVTYDQNRDLMYDALTGEVLRVNDGKDGKQPAPVGDGQVVIGGNFTADTDAAVGAGLEAIFAPRNIGPEGSITSPPQDAERSGTYAIDYEQNELLVDGISFLPTAPNFNPYYPSKPPVGQLSTGPGRPEMRSMDWDGDYYEDEIYCHAVRVINVWRMGRKLDWGANYPASLPCETDLLTGPQLDQIKPFQLNGDDYFLFYYQGGVYPTVGGIAHPEWAWNNGGPGRYTHYYEKLGHVWPHAGGFTSIPWDIGGDHREEILALSGPGLFAYVNSDPLGVPQKASPAVLPEYRRWRQEPVSFPFAWQDLPSLTNLEIRPELAELPSRVVGIPDVGGTLQLQAIATFSDGRTRDVTHAVKWIPDADTDAFLTLSQDGVVTANGERVSARIQAKLGELKSNTMYVYSTPSAAPEILMAGYEDTYLDQGNAATQRLRVVAYVAQRDNDPDLLVTMVTPAPAPEPPYPGLPETYWRPAGQTLWLLDNGVAANGDEVAGDGIYSAYVDPGPQDGDGIVLGDNLKFVQAALIDSSTTIMSSVSFNGSPNFVKGNTWPNVTIGGGSPTIYTPPPAPPTPVNELRAFWGPRVASCGTRGYGVDDDRILLEVRTLQSYVPSPLTVQAYLPWNGASVALTEQADGVYTALVDISGVANGAYLVDVRAIADYAGLLWPSDWCGRLYLHDYINNP